MYKKDVFIEKIFNSRQTEGYDCAVMFSGGKDSTYLLYLLKEVYKKKVLAVTVDNGFEHDWIWKQTKELTERMNVPHVIYRPGNENFSLLFETMIKEYEKFSVLGNGNHICYICNNLLWASTLKYASGEGIPFVISGLDPGQIDIIQKKDEYSSLVIERSIKIGMNMAKEIFKTTYNYNSNDKFRLFIDTLFSFPKNVYTIFAFVYLDYNVEDIKNTIVEKVGWEPPIPVGLTDYVTSGCKIADMIYAIQPLGIAKPRDKEQIMNLVNVGFAEKRLFNAFNKMTEKKIKYIDLNNSIFDELNTREFLIERCQKLKMKYR